VREPLLEVGAQRQVLVEQLRVVAIGEPARLPRLVESEPESVRMYFLTHCRPSFSICRGAPPPRPVPRDLQSLGNVCDASLLRGARVAELIPNPKSPIPGVLLLFRRRLFL